MCVLVCLFACLFLSFFLSSLASLFRILPLILCGFIVSLRVCGSARFYLLVSLFVCFVSFFVCLLVLYVLFVCLPGLLVVVRAILENCFVCLFVSFVVSEFVCFRDKLTNERAD